MHCNQVLCVTPACRFYQNTIARFQAYTACELMMLIMSAGLFSTQQFWFHTLLEADGQLVKIPLGDLK
jgi:hypothetical protein